MMSHVGCSEGLDSGLFVGNCVCNIIQSCAPQGIFAEVGTRVSKTIAVSHHLALFQTHQDARQSQDSASRPTIVAYQYHHHKTTRRVLVFVPAFLVDRDGHEHPLLTTNTEPIGH